MNAQNKICRWIISSGQPKKVFPLYLKAMNSFPFDLPDPVWIALHEFLLPEFQNCSIKGEPQEKKSIEARIIQKKRTFIKIERYCSVLRSDSFSGGTKSGLNQEK